MFKTTGSVFILSQRVYQNLIAVLRCLFIYLFIYFIMSYLDTPDITHGETARLYLPWQFTTTKRISKEIILTAVLI